MRRGRVGAAVFPNDEDGRTDEAHNPAYVSLSMYIGYPACLRSAIDVAVVFCSSCPRWNVTCLHLVCVVHTALPSTVCSNDVV